MIEHGEQLRDAFQAHEHLAPDAAAVYARVEELSRTYRRRRRGAQAAGGAVLGAGLVAGGLNLPGLLAGNSQTVVVQGPAAAPATKPSKAELERDWQAYFAAGYGYDDAVRLAEIWKVKEDVGLVKAEAGRLLLAGETLPIKPGPESTPTEAPVDPKEQAEVSAFFAAGYNYADAVKLSRLWKTTDPYAAKVEAGKKLLAGQTLPIKP